MHKETNSDAKGEGNHAGKQSAQANTPSVKVLKVTLRSVLGQDSREPYWRVASGE